MREGKNNAVECFRVFFTMIIVLHHGGTFLKTRLVTHGYIAVEFFFILSGYLLVTTFLRESSHSCWKYLWKRYARLYPEYIMAAIVMLAFSCLSTDRFVVEKAIPELLMLQNIGVFAGGGGTIILVGIYQ